MSWALGVPLEGREGARGHQDFASRGGAALSRGTAGRKPHGGQLRSQPVPSPPDRSPQARWNFEPCPPHPATFPPPAAPAYPGPRERTPLSPTTYLAKGPKILEKIALSTCLSEWPTAARPRVSRARQREPRSQRRLRSCIRLRRPRGSSAKSGARKAPAKEENAFGGLSWSGGELNPRDTPLGGLARTEAATDPGRLAANSASTLECRRGQVVRAGAPCSGCNGGGPSARAANAGSAIPPFRQLRVLRIRSELEFI